MKFVNLKLSFFTAAAVMLSINLAVNAATPSSRTAQQATLIDKTTLFLAYLGHLSDDRVLSVRGLRDFIERLEVGQLVNPVYVESADHSRPYESLKFQAARSVAQNFVEQFQNREIFINLEEVLAWAKNYVGERKQSEIQRQEVGGETDILDRKMTFNWVKRGEFQMNVSEYDRRQGSDDRAFLIPVSVSQDFEILSTRVKEWHWVMVMGSAIFYKVRNIPSKQLFPPGGRLNGATAVSSGQSLQNTEAVTYQVDWDVNVVPIDQIQDFLGRLNELSKAGSRILNELIEDHQPGDQFRLPSDLEWSFVVLDRNRSKSSVECGEVAEKFNQWVVEGAVFLGFDRENFEWVNDRRTGESFDRYIRRRAWSKMKSNSTKSGICRTQPHERLTPVDPGTGFRLVRIRASQ